MLHILYILRRRLRTCPILKKTTEGNTNCRVCLLSVHTLLQSTDQIQRLRILLIPAVPVCRRHLRLHCEWYPNVRCSSHSGSRKTFRHDSNDRVLSIVDYDLAADGIGLSTKTLSP